MKPKAASKAERVGHARTSEDVVVGRVGRDLYEKFFRGYTRKQWDLDPSELDASVTARVPVRTNRDDRYFTDTYQAMPLRGYTRMFENMLDHPNIFVMLNTDYRDIEKAIPYREMIYTGPVDAYFDFRYGKLPYRSLEFKFETHDRATFQATGTVNYPNEHRPPYAVSVGYSVTAPAGTRVSVETITGDVVVTGMKGDLSVGGVSGDVNISGAERLMSVRTISGDITLTDVANPGKLEAGSISGDLKLTNVKADRLEAGGVSTSVWAHEVRAAAAIISPSTRHFSKALRRASFSASKPMLVQTSVVTRSAPAQASIGSLKTR